MFSCCFRGSAESAQAAGPSKAPVLLDTNTLLKTVEYTRAFARRAALSRAKIKAVKEGGTGTPAFTQLEERVGEAKREVDGLRNTLRGVIVYDLKGANDSFADDLIEFLEQVIWQNACLLLGRTDGMMTDAVNATNKVQELACRISPHFKGSYHLTWRVQQTAAIMTIQECIKANVAVGPVEDKDWQKFLSNAKVAQYLGDAQKLSV